MINLSQDVINEVAVQIFLDDFMHLFQKSFPHVSILYFSFGFISHDKLLEIAKEEQVTRKLVILKLLLQSTDMSTIAYDSKINVCFYVDKLKCRKSLLTIIPGTTKVDMYRQLNCTFQNN